MNGTDRPRVAVSGSSGDAGQGIIKGLRLARRPPWILALDYFDDCAGFHLADHGVTMPAVRSLEYVERLIAELADHHVDLLFPAIADEIPLVAEARDRIERETSCQVVVSQPEVIEPCADKLHTARWLRGMGLASPATSTPDAGLKCLLAEVGLPLVAKPRRSSGSRGLFVIDTEEGLRGLLAEPPPDYCLQQYIDGPEYTCGLLFDRSGELRDTLCMRRRLHEGRTVAAEVEMPPGLPAFVERFASEVRAVGALNLQFRVPESGEILVFEINPRMSGSTALRIAAGFNDPLRLYEHFLDDQPIERAQVRPVRLFRYWTEIVLPVTDEARPL